MRRGRWKTVCARGADLAPSRGRSASPLEDATRFAYATKATRAKSRGKDPSFETAGARAVRVPGPGGFPRLQLRLSQMRLRFRLKFRSGRAPVCAEETARAQ